MVLLIGKPRKIALVIFRSDLIQGLHLGHQGSTIDKITRYTKARVIRENPDDLSVAPELSQT